MRIRHWIKWGFGCGIGPTPLAAWIVAHHLAGLPETRGAGATREFVFFSLSTASTALLSLDEKEDRIWSQMWRFSGLVITISSALFYGAFLTGEALHAALRVQFAYNVSKGLAIAAFIYGTLVAGITQPEPR